MAKAILVTGSRDWSSNEIIERELSKFPPGTMLIHGQAQGADSIADFYGGKLGHYLVRVPYFKSLGKAGGPVRNKHMLDILLGLQYVGYEIEVVAFSMDLVNSKGTKNMVEQAEAKGVRVSHYDH